MPSRRPRYRAKPDSNQPEILKGWRTLGYLAWNTSSFLTIPDCFVWGYDARLGLWLVRAVEIKTDTGDLSPEQQAFIDRWPGAVLVARSLDDVLAAYGQG